jgi:hypothetical protein
MPENEDAEFIYSIVEDQLIMTQNGPYAINQVAVHEAIRLYRVADKQSCFEKVLVLSRYFLQKERSKAGAI